jgi:putative membrane-bound dehydrogenase-like protein
MRAFSAIVLAGLLLPISHAEPAKEKDLAPEPLPRIAPKSPEESLKCFEIHPDFRIELAAAEPLVQSPVAAEFDEDGRLFVVELPEYNQYGSAKPHGKGRVVMLEDTDGDGKFDKRTVVVDNLDYPTAVFPWDGGLYVGAAPDLLYCKDGKRTVVLTGFGKDKAGEGQLNSFRWSLENRILISTGLDGGDIVHPGKDEKPVSVKSLNILLDPRDNRFETTSGGGQHGMTLDDWGNSFVCGNSDPCQHLVYDTRYLAKNPLVQAPPPAINIAPGGKYTKLHRISEVEPWRALRTKLRKEGAVPGSDEGGQPSGFFTGATGITVYRGDAYPEEFRGNVFVGEVANNLVFRARLEPKGVSFTAERADKDREFLASKDIWFRPVQFFQGPDGCLYVIDMYRELIEGAAFLAPPILKHVDPSAGVDKGRLWRIVPKDFSPRKAPKLSAASTEELVKLLEHPNGWHRDTAARLLYERLDRRAVPDLKKVIAESGSAIARMHALYALHGLAALPKTDFVEKVVSDDPNPRLREHGLRLLRTTFLNPVVQRLDDRDALVRYQALWSLRRCDFNNGIVEEAVVERIKKESDDRLMRLALFNAAANPALAEVFSDLAADDEFRKLPHAKDVLETLAEIIGAGNFESAIRRVVKTAIHEADEGDRLFAFRLVSGLLRRPSAYTQRYLEYGSAIAKYLDYVQQHAVAFVVDPKNPINDRLQAMQAIQPASLDKLTDLFRSTLKPDQPQPVQAAALELLGKTGHDKVPETILAAWPAMSPKVRATATEVFLSRPKWVSAFFDAVEQKKIARGDVDPARIALLLKSPNRAVRVRAEELFKGTGPGSRKDVIEAYQKALTLKGDLAKGKLVFKNNCSACHKLDGVGEEVGADIRAIRDRGIESMMLNILDPNREVKPQYLAYTLETTTGKSISGMITAETPNSVTIRRLDGTSETIQRGDIDKLRSTGLSFMPEGLEKQIDLQAMADLLAYLNSIK